MSINGFVDQHGQVQKYNYDELDNKPTNLNQFANGPGYITGINDHSINEDKLTSALYAKIENASFYSNAAIGNITNGNLNQKIKVNPFVIRTTDDLYGTIRVNRSTAVVNQNGSITFTPVTSASSKTSGFWIDIENGIVSSHKVYISCKGLSTTRSDFVKWRIFVSQSGERYLTENIEFTENNFSTIVDFTTLDTSTIHLSLLEIGSETNSSNTSFTLGSMQVIDLTEMFGAGFEPSLEEFEAVYGPEMPYSYRIPEIVEDLKDEKALILSAINTNDKQSIIYRKQLTSSDDMHALSYPGMYFVDLANSIPENFPYLATNGTARVLVNKSGTSPTNHYGETHFVMGTTSLWVERSLDGTGTNWSGWKKLSDTDELKEEIMNSWSWGFYHVYDDIVSSFPHDTVNGPMVSFSDGANNFPVRNITTTIKPFQKGNGDPSTSNIRALSGYTQIKLRHSKRNLWPGATAPNENPKNNITITPFNFLGYVQIESSAPASDITFSKMVYLNLKPGIYRKTPKTNGVSVYVQYIVNLYTDWREVPGGGIASDKFVITEEIANNYPIVVRIAVSSGAEFSEPYLYYPYIYKFDDGYDINWELATINETTISIPQVYSRNSIMGTVFDGEVNLTAGRAEVTKVKFSLGDLSWSYGTNNQGLRYFIGSGLELDVPRTSSSSEIPDFLSSNYKVVSANSLYYTSTAADLISIVGNWATYETSKGQIWILDSRYNDGSINGNEFKTILQNENAEIAFDFPQVIYPENGITPLSSSNSKTFLGFNNYWTDCGDIAIDYNADPNLYSERKKEENEYLSLNLHVKPDNKGVLNAIKRARQLTDIKWTPVNMILRGLRETSDTYATSTGDAYLGVFSNNKEYTGIPYSEVKYIGTINTLDCFATSIRNSKSAAIIESQDSTQPSNRACYYGTNCVSFIGHALDIPIVGSAYYSNIRYLTNLGSLIDNGIRYPVTSLKLCDILQTSSHTAMITDIIRNDNGEIIAIEISESTRQGNPVRSIVNGPDGGRCRRMSMAVDEFYNWFNGFIILRYQNLDEIPYIPNKYSPMINEPPPHAYWEMPCIPYEGNMCSYANPTGDSPSTRTVTILINDANHNYTHLQVFKEGSIYWEYQINNADSINVTCDTDEAIYTARLVKKAQTQMPSSTDPLLGQSISCTWAIRPYMRLTRKTISNNKLHIVMPGFKLNRFKPWCVRLTETNTMSSGEAASFYRIYEEDLTWYDNGDGTVNYYFDVPYLDSSKQYVNIMIKSDEFGTGAKYFRLT